MHTAENNAMRMYKCGCTLHVDESRFGFFWCPVHEQRLERVRFYRRTLLGGRPEEITRWEHTTECWFMQLEVERSIRAYRAEWPDHCVHCGGWGGFVWSDTEADPCDVCASNGRCARCGGDFYMDTEVCGECEFEAGNTTGEPEFYSCYGLCTEQEENAGKEA